MQVNVGRFQVGIKESAFGNENHPSDRITGDMKKNSFYNTGGVGKLG
jgi:hypothetical protein